VREFARHLDTIDERQRIVERGHIWLRFDGFEDRLLAVGSFCDHLPVRVSFQDSPQP
jgi:hypothetical protein